MKILDHILRDSVDGKLSLTRIATLVTLLMFTIQTLCGVWIMIITKTIDHIIIGEVIAVLLTLLGYKNNFGVTKTGININNSTSTDASADNTNK
jgi:hypothetical protein